MKAPGAFAGAALAFLLSGLASFPAGAADPLFLTVTPERIDWKLVRKEPPLHRAFIQGNQEAPGAFTFRVRAAAGVRSKPRFSCRTTRRICRPGATASICVNATSNPC